jgi:glycerol-3-phosphate acyltransferase PlsY
MLFVLMLITAYLLGSFPTSVLLVKMLKGVDIRDYGSGNAGGTNVSRVLGWRWGVLVILVDLFKGWLAVRLVPLLIRDLPVVLDSDFPLILAGVAAILGHVFPVFAGFRGGKGVATAAGVALGLAPWAMIWTLLVFAPVLYFSRYMFLASLSGGLVFTLVVIFSRVPQASLKWFAGLVLVILVIMHRSNIARFRRGKENRLGQRVQVEKPMENEVQK